MELKIIPYRLTVCKVTDISAVDINSDFYFIGKTDEELSLVCRTEDTPSLTIERDDGWRGFRIQGTLDFSLIGILSKLSGILAEHKILFLASSGFASLQAFAVNPKRATLRRSASSAYGSH